MSQSEMAMADFHSAMSEKEEIEEASKSASEYCEEKFNDTSKTAACRVGVGRLSRVLKERVETDDPRTVDGRQPDSSFF